MSRQDDFFIGWSADTPRRDRRFMLGAGLALIPGAGALAAVLAPDPTPLGEGFWDQGEVRTLRGWLDAEPYPALRTLDLDGEARTVFLATSGKSVPSLEPSLVGRAVSVIGTLIVRGRNAMMALASMEPATQEHGGERSVIDHGPAMLVGEILDAKCWFGAMRPGSGPTHKACAALCARGGLPLAFCQIGLCGDDGVAPLLLDDTGRAFGREILPYLADPVALIGRMIEVDAVMQIRAPLDRIRRL